MAKDPVHADSFDDALGSDAVRPVPNPDHFDTQVYGGFELFFAAERGLAWLMRAVMFTTMIALGLLMAAQVFMRYAISSPFLGIEELAPLLALWSYFLGMAYCSRDRDHIEGGVMTLVVKNPRTLLLIRLFGSVVSLIALLVFLWFVWGFAAFNYSIGRASPYTGLSKTIWDMSMVIGFVLMSFYGALQIIAEIRMFMAMKRAQT